MNLSNLLLALISRASANPHVDVSERLRHGLILSIRNLDENTVRVYLSKAQPLKPTEAEANHVVDSWPLERVTTGQPQADYHDGRNYIWFEIESLP